MLLSAREAANAEWEKNLALLDGCEGLKLSKWRKRGSEAIRIFREQYGLSDEFIKFLTGYWTLELAPNANAALLGAVVEVMKAINKNRKAQSAHEEEDKENERPGNEPEKKARGEEMNGEGNDAVEAPAKPRAKRVQKVPSPVFSSLHEFDSPSPPFPLCSFSSS